jgi:beta-galactosidase
VKRFATGAAILISSVLLCGQSAENHPDWPGKGQLFVGTCYQPVDRSPEEIRRDIALMRDAGFTIVRMGDLSWDSFEPSEGQFTFSWFDDILRQMNKAGIKVILDISGLPAPIWLHHKYPSVILLLRMVLPCTRQSVTWWTSVRLNIASVWSALPMR